MQIWHDAFATVWGEKDQLRFYPSSTKYFFSEAKEIFFL